MAKRNHSEPGSLPLSRRSLLERTCLGFGSMVLADLLRADNSPPGNFSIPSDLKARRPHFPAKAKAVIQLVQNGGPSQMDLFDPKPELTRRAGQAAPGRRRDPSAEQHEHPACRAVRVPASTGSAAWMFPKPLPHTARRSRTSLCFVRSMHTEHNNHLEGLNMLLTCKIFPGRPVMGAWISYALGTENQNLPAYVVLRDPTGYTIGGKQLWANGYLPALYQGVEFSMKGAPVHHLNPPEPLPPGAQRDKPRPIWRSSTRRTCAITRANRSSKPASRISSWRRGCSSPPAKCWTSPRKPKRPANSTAWTIR